MFSPGLSKKILLLLAFPTVVLAWTLVTLGNYEFEAQRQLQRSLEASALMERLRDLDLELANAFETHSTERMLMDADEAFAKDDTVMDKAIEKFRLIRESATDSDSRKALEKIQADLYQVEGEYKNVRDDYLQNRSRYEFRKPMWAKLRKDAKITLGWLIEFNYQQSVAVNRLWGQQAKSRDEICRFLVVAGLTSLGSLLILAPIFVRGIVRRLHLMIENSERFASGKALNAPLPGNDEISRLDASFHDMTEKLISSSLRERAMVSNAQEIIFSMDTDMRFVSINPACAKLLKIEEETPSRHHLNDYLSSDEILKVMEQFERTKSRDKGQTFELNIRPVSGIVVEMSLSVTWSAAERLFYCIGHNISDRKAVERLREDSISMLNHDLRSPLTAIRVNFDSIRKDLNTGDIAGAATKILRSEKSCEMVINLTTEILDWDKLNSGTVTLNKVLCDLGAVAMMAAESQQSLMGNKPIEFDFEPDSVMLKIDPDQIQRVIVNLLSNAIKHSRSGSRIEMSIKDDGANAIVCVKDEGSGMSKVECGVVFERYRQLEEGRRAGGAGLGLAICKSIVELHGGKIWVESEKDRGSRFYVQLPKG